MREKLNYGTTSGKIQEIGVKYKKSNCVRTEKKTIIRKHNIKRENFERTTARKWGKNN